MPERYLWTPWDVDEEGTRTWPTDFQTIQNAYKASASDRSTHNLHSLADVGRLVVVSGPADFVADHVAVPGVISLGDTLVAARGWVEANLHRRAKEFLTHFESVLAPLRNQDVRSKTQLLTRFLPDQLMRGKTSRRTGTFTETWTGTNGDPWPSVWTNTELDTLDATNPPLVETIDIQSNRGSAAGPVGGLSRRIGFTFAYNGDEATNMNVKVTNVSAGSERDGPAVRIENGGGFDTFYYFNNRSVAGDDTRLFKVIDETRTEEASNSLARVLPSREYRLVVENDGSGDPALDGTVWASAASEPGTPTFSHTDTEVDAITGSGFGGMYDVIERDAVVTWDDFEMTNNDGAAAVKVRRRLGTLGVGR